ncbi:MAG: alanine racemase [Methylococcales bacterium]|nr:alanine racemase [Methylococcales bacterium]
MVSTIISSIEGVSVEELATRYGSPLFVVSERQLRQNIQGLFTAFQSRYSDVVYGWSYKTNYSSAIAQILHQEGAWAEVVSKLEYEKARSLGIDGDKIIFNGPYKPKNILQQAVIEGAHIHVDHFDELTLLQEIGTELNHVIPLTLRLNFETGFSESWSRFGFNIENGQALAAAHQIKKSAVLKLQGLHSHIGTFILDTRAYAAQTRIMCAFMEVVEEATGCEINSLDMGGGFVSHHAMQGIKLPENQIVPTMDDYAEAICTPLLRFVTKRLKQGKPQPRLILESGRAMVDDAVHLITRVVATKKLPNGQRAAILDAGVNLFSLGHWYDHKIQLTQKHEGDRNPTNLYGPLCMNTDIIRHQIPLPPLTYNDRLIISPMGAYNHSQSLQFIEYRPNVVMIYKNGSMSTICRAENLKTVTFQENIQSF